MKLVLLVLSLYMPSLYADLIDEIEDESNSTEVSKPVNKSKKNKDISDSKKKKDREKQKKSVDYNKKKPRRSPIKIKSSGTSTFSKNKNLITLDKDVVITQENLRLESNRAEVYIERINGEEVVERAVLKGGVHVSKFDPDESKIIKARGDEATFFNSKQQIELNGNARLWKGGHLIKGKRIVYDIKSGMISVDEARGVVQPGEIKND